VKPIASIRLILLMLAGLIAVVVHRIRRDMGFGCRFIQVLAIVEGLPLIALLAISEIPPGEANCRSARETPGCVIVATHQYILDSVYSCLNATTGSILAARLAGM